MFEGQYDSSSLTGKTWTDATASNDIAAWGERNDQDEPASFFIQSSSQKSLRSDKTLHSHPDIKDVAEANYSSCSNTWSVAPQTDDAEHSFGSNSSKQQGAFTDVCEKGTQTAMVDDEVMSQSVSSSAQCSWLDHSAVTESELVTRLDGSSTKA